MAVPGAPAQAANTVPFTPKFSANGNGAIVSLGNNLLTCPSSARNCADARGGGAYDNNGFVMTNLDADSDPTTNRSSASRLNLPDGATVLWAGLYWGARLDAGSGGQPGTGDYDEISFRAPGDGAYRTLTASTATRDQFGPNTRSYRAYQRFADVTSVVREAGNGDYWGADVVAATGQDRYAGWAMTVVYTAPGLPLRNLTVFDGFDLVTQQSPQTVSVSGFQAPPFGTVDAQLSMVAYEGDLAQTGDYTRLNNTQLATSVSPGSNFFASVNTRNNAIVTTRTPADRNMLGFDIKNLGASGAVPNGATSATFRFSSNGDQYYPGVLGMAINLYAPDFTASSKSVTNLSGNDPARPGDTLQYTLNYANTGQDPAVDVVSEDALPPDTTYVPGSLRLVGPTGTPTPVTDAAGDDVGEVDGRTVRVRLGGGADATSGGRMACSGTGCTDDGTSRAGYSFQVTLDDAAAGATVTNLATLDYRTQTTGTGAQYTTNPAVVTVQDQADVAITKELDPDPAVVGSAVSATLTVRNDGPSTATGVTVTDAVPDGWTGVTATTPQGSCDVSGGTVTCALGDLPDGGAVPITLRGATSSGSTATALTNVASVSTTTSDPVPSNNVAGDTVTLVRRADLSIAKTPAQQTGVPGDEVTWTITVTNDGASDAVNARIDDAFAVAGLARITDATITVTAGQDPTCLRPVGRSVRCAVALLPAGESATVTVTGVLAGGLAAGTDVVNTTRVSSDTPDPDPSDNQDTAVVTTAGPQADVRVSKTGPADVVAGQQIAWTVTATNFGPSDAAGVVLTDTVPPGVTPLAAQPSRGTCTVTGRDVVCDAGTLLANGAGAAGGTVTVTITGTVDPGVTGTLRNEATAAADTDDPDAGNNTGSVDTAVTAEYDLAVSKTANRTTLPGMDPPDTRPVDYVVTVTNNGPSTATGVVVTDLVPTALELLSATPTGGGGCTGPEPTDDPEHDELTCTLSTPIAPGESQTVEVDMLAVVNLAEIGDPVTQTATVEAEGDTNPDNDSATWTLAGDPFVDLALTKAAPATVTAGAVPAGERPVYTLQVTNTNDPGDVTENVAALRPVISDTLPDGVTFDSASVTSGDGQDVECTVAGQDLTCQLTQDLAAGTSATVEIVFGVDADVPAGTTLVNTASVETANMETNPDTNLANNTATASSIVVALADPFVASLAIAPVDPGTTGPGSTWTFTFDVGNNGPSTARRTELRMNIDVLDAWLADPLQPGDLPGGCSVVDTELVCPLGDLAPGQEATYTFEFTVTGYAEPGTYEGSVQVSTTTPEPDTTPARENNRATTDLVVTDAVTDLTVTKSALDTVPNPDEPVDPHPSFVAGGEFTYQISVEVPDAGTPGTGLADARGVVVTDTLPLGFTAQQAGTAHGTCDLSTADGRSVVTCDLGTVAGFAGSTPPRPAVVTVHGVLDPDANDLNGGDRFAEQVENTAVVTTDTPLAGGGGSVSATAAVDIVEIADLQIVKTPDTPDVIAGGSAGYTLTVVNAGPSGVEHAVVTDSLPVGFTLDPARSQCEPPRTAPEDETQAVPRVPDGPGDEIACRIGVLAAGATASIHIVATTDATQDSGTFTNTATIGSLANEGDTSNNTATADVTLGRLTNLAISSAVSTTTPAAGQDVTFTGFAVNNGPSTAVGTNGDTTFPPGFVPVSVDVPFNDCTWNRTPPPDPAAAPWEDFRYVLHCEPVTPGAQWEPGGAATNVVVMHVPGDTPAGPYTGSSVIRSDTPETTLEDNETSQTVVVQHVSDTHVTKELVAPDPLQAGRPATWRITATNGGPSIADNVVISDTVPDGMTFVAATDEDGDDCPAPEVTDDVVVVKCPMGSLAVGGSVSALVTFGVPADAQGADLCNTALVGSGALDRDAADNEAEACGPVAAPPGVTLDKTARLNDTDGDDAADAGETVVYTFAVTNTGSSTLEQVTVDDPALAAAGVEVDCPDQELAAGDTVACTATYTVTPQNVEAGTVVNQATASAVSPDPDGPGGPLEGETVTSPPSTATVPTDRRTDVAIELTPPRQEARAGDTVDLTATVRNNGPAPANGVVATFEVPAAYTGVSGVLEVQQVTSLAVPSSSGVRLLVADATCRLADRALTCRIGDLAVGEEAVYTLSGTVDGAPGDVIEVPGTVTHDADDTVPANDSDSALVELSGPPPTPTPSPTPTPTPGGPEPGPTDPPPAGPPAAEPPQQGQLPGLAVTGPQIGWILLVALLAVGTGTALVVVVRRRAYRS